MLPGVAALVRDGIKTGASGRNWASFGSEVALGRRTPPDWAQDLLCDPQTSGGLLIAAGPEAVDEVLVRAKARGFGRAAVIGTFEAGGAGIEVL